MTVSFKTVLTALEVQTQCPALNVNLATSMTKN